MCVGIEDPHDLLDDLERALIAAGAIEFNALESKYVRAPVLGVGETISRAVEQLALGGELFVSAPGKVILFGEHAVVHGVVSYPILSLISRLSDEGTFCLPLIHFRRTVFSSLVPWTTPLIYQLCRLQLPLQWTSGAMALRPLEMTESSLSSSMTSITSIMNGTLTRCLGTP